MTLDTTLDCNAARFFKHVDKTSLPGHWLWTAGHDQHGYGNFWVLGPSGSWRDGTAKEWKAHRWSWVCHNGPIPDDLHVLHHCDTPPCVNPECLFLGTEKDNSDDKIAKGRARFSRGEQCYQAKLTAVQIEEIRKRYKGPQHRYRTRTGPSQQELAAEYGIGQSLIGEILRGVKWKSAPGKLHEKAFDMPRAR